MRHVALVAELDEMRALQRGLREQHAVVGDDADRQAVDMGEAAHQRRAVSGLNSWNSLPSTMRAMISRWSNGMREIGADDAGNFGEIVNSGAPDRALLAMDLLRPVQRADDVARLGDRLQSRRGEMVGNAGNRAVHFRAAERFAVDDLVDRGLDDLRSAEMDAAVAADHHDFVRQRRDVGAAGGAFAEHGRDLRNARSRHPALADRTSPPK